MQLPPFKLERYFATYEFKAEYLLCSSDCESLSIADLLSLEQGAADEFQRLWLGYTESLGSPTLRKEIAKIYETIQPEDNQSLTEVAKGIGCDVTPWLAREETKWALDLDELKKLLRPNTKVIVVNTPHNPTGYLMSHADFESVNRFAQENNLLLFFDEVYRESEYDPSMRLLSACDMGEHAVSLGVTSKTYGLAGLRIGWIATKNKKIYENMASLKDYTTICNSAPSEFLAEVAIRNRQNLVERNLGIIKHNLEIMDEFFTHHTDLFSWVRPQAGSMGFPKFLHGNIEEFCDMVVRKTGILLLPGTMYDDTGNHFRVGLGRKNLPKAVERIEEYLSNQRNLVVE